MGVKIILQEGEPIDKALRRMSKKLSEDGTLKDYKRKLRYEKPSDKKRRKAKEAKQKAKKNQRKNRRY